MERKGKQRKAKESKGKQRKAKQRKGKQRKAKESEGKQSKGKQRKAKGYLVQAMKIDAKPLSIFAAAPIETLKVFPENAVLQKHLFLSLHAILYLKL